MAAVLRAYSSDPRFGEDYNRMRTFLLRLDSSNYHFGRWDWMVTHRYLDSSAMPKIGLWLEDGAVVAAATFDTEPGGAFLLTLPGYEPLREAMLAYAREALAKDGKCNILIPDGDTAQQTLLLAHGYRATQNREHEALYLLNQPVPDAPLPDGFAITSMRETYDLYRYGQVLWKGFNHEANGEGPFVFAGDYHAEFQRPNVNLDLKIAVVAPNGDFVSYCGMWHDTHSDAVLVEPVATDPAYRKMGLGRAAVLEGLRRCRALGATRAYVGSSQQFYYSIGFRPHTSNTWWAEKA